MADQAYYVVRAEGVNFSATLEDTEDLSTTRGAGLALLALGDAVKIGLANSGARNIELLFAGASQAEFWFTALPGQAEQVRQSILAELRHTGPQREPFPHLSFVVDVVQDAGDAEKTSAIVEARNRSRQFREWTIPLPEFRPDALQYDKLDRMRPGRVRPGWGKDPVSDSTAARHEFGRDMRQGFYVSHAGWKAAEGLAFVDSFEAIVARPPDELPLSPRSGMAVIYADGNGFNSIRGKVGVERFSRELDAYRGDLLRRVLAWYREGLRGPEGRFAPPVPGPKPPLRFETLMWGGDELMFVMPSWLAFAFVQGFFAASAPWRIGEGRLTHTAGLVICHYKTPIRQARSLAKRVVEEIKDKMRDARQAPCNAVGIEIFESLMPPDDDLLDAHRARSFGVSIERARSLTLDLALPGDELGALIERMCNLSRGEPALLPRSQLYRILRTVKATTSDLASTDASLRAREEFIEHERRVRKAGQIVTTSGLRLPRLPGVPARSLAVELALVAALWDYASPFADDPLPRFV